LDIVVSTLNALFAQILLNTLLAIRLAILLLVSSIAEITIFYRMVFVFLVLALIIAQITMDLALSVKMDLSIMVLNVFALLKIRSLTQRVLAQHAVIKKLIMGKLVMTVIL
jgi:hypothetical protein